MESTSAELAQELLSYCLKGANWPEALLDCMLQDDDTSRALFSIVVEGLSDLFEPALCDVYAELFSEVIGRVLPDDLHGPHLLARYRRVRHPRNIAEIIGHGVRNVFVLSRVTLGADVAVTSTVLDGAKRAFPDAHVYFVGPQKSWELFAGDDRIQHLPVQYGRTSGIRDRFSVWAPLREAVCRRRSIVIDPDSRLTQLGLLPLCSEKDYFFFESRAYRADSHESLVRLTQRWVAETFHVDAKPFIEPMPMTTALPEFATTVSFGVGENLNKCLPDPFETELLKRLPQPILLDKGAGGEEAERVERAVEACGCDVKVWDGSFAGFANHIRRSGMYVGYDSAGAHVAAACGVPMVSIFAGYPSERFFDRWKPTGDGPIRVVKCGSGVDSWPQIVAALDEIKSRV